MSTITAGSGATISATTAESMLTGLVWLLQTLEASTSRNPTGINNVTSSNSDDNQAFNATINFKATVADDSSGNAVFSCIDYLTTPSGSNPHWTPGSGGTITSTTIQGAIWEVARLIDLKENTNVSNPTGVKNISWNVTNADIGGSNQSTVNISVTNFPLTITVAANGTQSLAGKEYLS